MNRKTSENTSRFAALWKAAVERIQERGRGALKEVEDRLGFTRNIWYQPTSRPRAVGDDVVMKVAEEAGLSEDETAALLLEWFKERVESGALGRSIVILLDAFDSMPDPKGIRRKAYVEAVRAYIDALGSGD